jgi:uncharacterized phage protein (TIGR01671 family)
MNREIKFRGKDINTGEWVYGAFVPDALEKTHGDMVAWGFIRRHNKETGKMETIEIDRESVGQFTGLRDIVRTEEFPEGQETFEDDLLQSQVGAMYIWQVKFEDGAYILEQINGPKKRGKQRHVQDFCCKDDIELYQLVKIGNIYDNPELLEGVAG